MGKECHAVLQERMLCEREKHVKGLAGRSAEEEQDDCDREIARTGVTWTRMHATEAKGYKSRTKSTERDAIEMGRVEGGKARANTGVRDRAKGSERC